MFSVDVCLMTLRVEVELVNESKTEALVRDQFVALGYFEDNDIIIEEKKSDSPRIEKILKHASKKGDGKGYPEFIVSSKTNANFIIVVECKASVSKHESPSRDKYADYAVDGVLLYLIPHRILKEIRHGHAEYLCQLPQAAGPDADAAFFVVLNHVGGGSQLMGQVLPG